MESGQKKRARVPVACEPCRRGKRKCDGNKPRCSLCHVHFRECVYAEEQPRKRARIGDLEAEISRLRSIVDDLKQRPSASEVDASGQSPSSSSTPAHRCADGERESPISSPFIQGIDKESNATRDLGILSWDTTLTNSGQSIFYGPTGIFSSPALSNLRKRDGASRSETQSKVHPAVVRAALQDEAFRARLIDDFENCVNSHNRFVSPETLDALRKAKSIPPHFQFLYTAILAFGAAVSSDVEAREMCSLLVDSAQSNTIRSCQQHSTLHTVQGLSILAWLELGRGNDTSGWIFSSLAGAMVVHQGLHVQENEPLEISTQDSEVLLSKLDRIRTFWSFFWVNRLAAAILGRSTLIPWRQVKVPPLSSVRADPITTMTIEDACLDSICQLWSLHDRHMEPILSFSFPALDAARKDALLRSARLALAQFRGTVDDRLGSFDSQSDPSSPPAAAPFYFQISYHISLILLHRPFLHATPQAVFSSALRAMVAAAAAVTDLLRRFRARRSFANVPPFMIYHILRAAAVLLLLATSSSSASASSSSAPMVEGRQQRPIQWPSVRLKVCLEALEECGRTWPDRSKHAVRAVQELAARWGVVKALPLRWSGVVASDHGSRSPAGDALGKDGNAEEEAIQRPVEGTSGDGSEVMGSFNQSVSNDFDLGACSSNW